MRAARSGAGMDYELFLREFSVSLRRIITHQLHGLGLSAAETEDIVQEVLIAVHSKRDQWDERRPLIAWLNAITRYKIIDTARRLRKVALRRIQLTDQEWNSLLDEDAGQEDHHTADVERLVAQLPNGQQAVVRAIGLQGDTPREAALRLGMSEGAIRVAFHRSLKKLMAKAGEQS
ncbi:sigma-70 family RNA polymerase sigma factor [Brucella intermedia]|uniref:sigma-70 family RNA polymerase sigma factor n=1 Tax=Brucella intermedia TaxID=94625 RepID=UPI003AB21D26